VVGCHSFSRDQGEEGYFLISAHILLVHGHIMPLTTRLLALGGEVPVSPLFRDILRTLITQLQAELGDLDLADRMSVYEGRNQIYLSALAHREILYRVIAIALERHYLAHGADPRPALRVLQLDQALCPRKGGEHTLRETFSFDAQAIDRALSAMELPLQSDAATGNWTLDIHHPGGVGEILHVADGGSWLRGTIRESKVEAADVQYVAIA